MKLSKGFTLIELIVVMAVFLFVIGTALGIFISIVQNQKRVLAEQQVLSQISYVEEYMSKALRMANVAGDDSCIPQGHIYLLTNYDQSSQFFRGIKFINQSDVNPAIINSGCQEFYLDNGILKEVRGNASPVALTSDKLKINSIKFSVNGVSSADRIQPRVTILLNVNIPGDNQGANRIIQTTVSQRNINK